MRMSVPVACPDCLVLESRVEELTAENRRLRDENRELRRRLALYENPHTPPSRKWIRLKPKPQRRRDPPRFPGRPRGHPGKTRPTPRPDVVIPPPRKELCDHCGSSLGEPCDVGHSIIEEISKPAPRKVIDYLEYGYTCKMCGSHTTARHPDCPPEGRFGRNLLVQATLMKYRERLPHVKVCEALEHTYDLSITPATVLDITYRVSRWLRLEYEAILQRIRGSPVVYADETGVKVDGVNHWIWVFTTRTDTLTAIRRSRGKKVLKEILGEGFRGFIVCDGWRSYSSFTDRIQRCWSHLLREADHLAEKIDEASQLSQMLHQHYDRIKGWSGAVDKPPPEEAAKLALEGERLMTRLAGLPWSREETRSLATKIRNGIGHWHTFLETPGVEATNNRAERALREHVVQRKIIGCFRNRKGTRIYETITTVLATWKQQNRELPQTLAETLTQQWNKS